MPPPKPAQPPFLSGKFLPGVFPALPIRQLSTYAPSKQQSITIVGSGAVGQLFAASIIEANKHLAIDEEKVKVSILGSSANSQSLTDLKEKGVKVTMPSDTDSFTIKPEELLRQGVCITHDPREIKKQQDYVIVCTKAYSNTPEFIKSLKGILKPGGIILLAQNGLHPNILNGLSNPNNEKKFLKSVDPDGKIAQELGQNSGVIILNLAVTSLGNGEIKSSNAPGNMEISIGMPDESDSDVIEKLFNLQKIFSNTNIRCSISFSGIRLEVFKKLQISMAINPISVLTGLTIGEILKHDLYSHLVQAIVEEANQLAIRTLYPQGLRTWSELKTRLERSAAHKTSMLVDHEKGRKLETDAILKAPLGFIAWAYDHGICHQRPAMYFTRQTVALLDKFMLKNDREKIIPLVKSLAENAQLNNEMMTKAVRTRHSTPSLNGSGIRPYSTLSAFTTKKFEGGFVEDWRRRSPTNSTGGVSYTPLTTRQGELNPIQPLGVGRFFNGRQSLVRSKSFVLTSAKKVLI